MRMYFQIGSISPVSFEESNRNFKIADMSLTLGYDAVL